MENDDRFDNLFTTVATSAKGIEPLLDAFFGFLQRKTDFFIACDDVSEPERLVLNICRKHQKLALPRKQKIKRENTEKNAARIKKFEEEEQAAREAQERFRKEAERPKVEDITEEDVTEIVKPQPEEKCDTKLEEKHDTKPEANDSDQSDDGEDNPVKHGNGGVTDKYSWTQTLSSAEVFVNVPPGTKGRNCNIQMTSTTLKLGLKGQPFIIDGLFCEKIKPKDSFWTIVENKMIQLTLEKADGMKWWNCVIKGDPTINTKKVVPENSRLSDLDLETRATVEKMMYDQQQKQLGRPTSDQMKNSDLLEKFKKQHPEMDFSQAKINWGGMSDSRF